MSRSVSLLFVTSIPLAHPAASEDDRRSRIEILRTGTFHGEEVGEVAGEPWYGLVGSAQAFALEAMKIRVEPAFDPILDEDESIMTGKRVTVDRERDPVVLIRGGPWLSQRSVTTAKVSSNGEPPAQPLELELGERRYRIVHSWKGEATPYRDALPEYRLRLERDGSSQVLLAPDWCCDEAYPSLVWAGDLDADGKLDLLLDTTTHYNVSRYELYLSQGAAPGSLVRSVATFEITGC